jgi:hypothetical protein
VPIATGYSEGFSSRYVTLSSVAPTPLLSSFPILSAPPLRTSPPVSSLLFRSALEMQDLRALPVLLTHCPPCPLSLLIFSRSHTAHPSSFILFLPHLMSTSLSSLCSPFITSPLTSHVRSDSRCLLHYLLPSAFLRMRSYRSPRYPRGQ